MRRVGLADLANVAAAAIFSTIVIMRNMWKAAHPAAPEITDEMLIARMEGIFADLGVAADIELERLRRPEHEAPPPLDPGPGGGGLV